MSEGYEDTQTLMITNPMVALSPTVRSTTIETIVDRVYAELERRIVTCELAPGSLLSEAELSMQLNVSRTPVGEALQRLAREGLVNILPRRGILVTDISVSEQVQLLEFRRDVSRLIARTSARRAKPHQRERMREIAAAFAEAGRTQDDAQMIQADKDFHDLFVQCAHNTFAARAMVTMDSLSRRFWLFHRDRGGEQPASVRLHSDIASAIANADEAAAAKASDALSDYLDEFTRNTLNPCRHPLDHRHKNDLRGP